MNFYFKWTKIVIGKNLQSSGNKLLFLFQMKGKLWMIGALIASLICQPSTASTYLIASGGDSPPCDILGRSYCKDIDGYPE